MTPRPAARIAGSAARVTRMAPKTLVSNTLRASPSVTSSTAPEMPSPALLTRTSMPP